MANKTQKVHRSERDSPEQETYHFTNNMDITGKVDVSKPACVYEEIKNIFSTLYAEKDFELIEPAFDYFELTYSGKHPDYHQTETPYHNIHHVMDVTLATARLIDGYEQKNPDKALGAERASLGIIIALFHDSGYLRYSTDFESKHGAEHTKIHVSRSGEFIQRFLIDHDKDELTEKANVLVQYTGLEHQIEDLDLTFEDELYLTLGYLIGTADVIAQMSDIEYIEKCEAHLYDEFLIGGLTHRKGKDGSTEVVYSSAQDLLRKTPAFMKDIIEHRCDELFHKAYDYAAVHFGGANLYMEGVANNRTRVEKKILELGLA